jgi:hypothetical protein
MIPEKYSNALKDIEGENEEGRMAIKEVTGKALDILKKYGKFRSLSFVEHAKKIPFALRHPLTREEAVNSHSVSRTILNNTDEPIEVTVTSYGKKEPSRAHKISVTIPGIADSDKQMDTLLFSRKGLNIGVILWNGSKDAIFWQKAATMEHLKLASRALGLLQENLSSKK